MKAVNNQKAFHEHITGTGCLVQFSAQWCGPCKVLTKTLASESFSSMNIAKLDIDVAPDIAAEFNIRSVPTLVYFSSGKEVDRTMGAKPENKIHEFINKCKA